MLKSILILVTLCTIVSCETVSKCQDLPAGTAFGLELTANRLFTFTYSVNTNNGNVDVGTMDKLNWELFSSGQQCVAKCINTNVNFIKDASCSVDKGEWILGIRSRNLIESQKVCYEVSYGDTSSSSHLTFGVIALFGLLL